MEKVSEHQRTIYVNPKEWRAFRVNALSREGKSASGKINEIITQYNEESVKE